MVDPSILNDKVIETLGITLGSVGAGAVLAELGYRLGEWIDRCFHKSHKTGRKHGRI